MFQAAIDLARQLNPELFMLIADVAIVQAEDEVPQRINPARVSVEFRVKENV